MKDLVILILALITITAVGTAAYLYGKTQNPSLSLNSVSGTATPVSSSTPVATNSASVKGVVTGRLCFPASILPKGKIVAKNVTTNELTSQDYPGSDKGGGMTYTLSLSDGSYYLKYDATTTSGTLSGFYTSYSSCVVNSTSADCSGQKTRPLVSVDVKDGATVTDVNLCDFYYPSDNPPKF